MGRISFPSISVRRQNIKKEMEMDAGTAITILHAVCCGRAAELLLARDKLHWKRRTALRMSSLPANAYKRQVTAGVQCEVWRSCLVSDRHVWTCTEGVREHSQAVTGFTSARSGSLYLPFPRKLNRCILI